MLNFDSGGGLGGTIADRIMLCRTRSFGFRKVTALYIFTNTVNQDEELHYGFPLRSF